MPLVKWMLSQMLKATSPQQGLDGHDGVLSAMRDYYLHEYLPLIQSTSAQLLSVH